MWLVLEHRPDSKDWAFDIILYDLGLNNFPVQALSKTQLESQAFISCSLVLSDFWSGPELCNLVGYSYIDRSKVLVTARVNTIEQQSFCLSFLVHSKTSHLAVVFDCEGQEGFYFTHRNSTGCTKVPSCPETQCECECGLAKKIKEI